MQAPTSDDVLANTSDMNRRNHSTKKASVRLRLQCKSEFEGGTIKSVALIQSRPA